jgi:hypothetical protein
MEYKVDNAELTATLTAVNLDAAVIGQAPLEVAVGESARIDVGTAINYIKSGQAEIEAAVQEGTAAFDLHANEKRADFNENASNKTATFNQNASNKTAAFNTNAESQFDDYNANASNKLNAYNQNASDKTVAYNLNAAAQTTAFNDNATIKQAAVDASADAAINAKDDAIAAKNNAQIWAEGTDAQVQGLGGEHSAKGWASQEANYYNVTATGSTTSRTLKDRFTDIINVKDFGAKGNGITDDTAAFAAAGAHGYVPSGEYVVSSLSHDISGDGIIYCTSTGQKFRAGGAFIAEDTISREHKLGEPFFGVNDGVNNTEIYTYASRGIQGAAYVKQGDNEYLFISQTATPSNGSDAGNSCRITQFAINSDGTIQPQHIAFSHILPIGHGQGMGVTIESGEIYLWCQSAYDENASKQYRGVTKIHWRGSSTTASDVQEIPLIPNTGVYSNYQGLTPAVSTDGKYLISHVSGARDYMCLIWKIEGITAYSKPIKQFIIPQNQGIGTVQGKCADTNYIYFLASTGGLYDYQAIFIYDYSGNLIKTKYIGCEKALKGGIDAIVNDTTGLWYIFENEGIYCRNGDICVAGYAVEQPFGDIVELDGVNYACIRNADGTQIYDRLKFQPTSKTATVAYATNTQYESGMSKAINSGQKYWLKNYKYVYSIGRIGNIYAEDTTLLRSRIAQYNSGNNATINTPKGNSFIFNYFNYVTGTVEQVLYANYRNMYFYDRYPTGQGYIGNFHWQHTDTEQNFSINVGTTQKAQLYLYGDNDNNENYFKISYNNKDKLYFTKEGVAIFNTSDYSAINNQGIVFTRNGMTNKSGAIYSTGSAIHYTGQEFLALEALDNSSNIKVGIIISGTYCRPITSNSTTLGDASRLWKEIFCANATINTSDERLKQDIEDIDERVFRAWEKVDFKQFRFKQAVNAKGENARIHFGVIAQQVKEAFESEGLDGFKYGLLCYDEWEDEFEENEITDKPAEYDEEGNVISPAEVHTEKKLVRAAGNAYGIRYGEALALECAYQRWKLEQLEQRLA